MAGGRIVSGHITGPKSKPRQSSLQRYIQNSMCPKMDQSRRAKQPEARDARRYPRLFILAIALQLGFQVRRLCLNVLGPTMRLDLPVLICALRTEMMIPGYYPITLSFSPTNWIPYRSNEL